MDPLTPNEIRAIRKRLGLTWQQFAELLGVSVSTVGGWENGRHRPRPLSLRMLRNIDTIQKSEKETT